MFQLLRKNKMQTREEKAKPPPSGAAVRVVMCGVVEDIFPLRLEWEAEKSDRRISMSYWSSGADLDHALERGLNPHLILVYSSFGKGLSPMTYTHQSGATCPVYLLGNYLTEPTRGELKQVFNEIHSRIAAEVLP